ncbi:MAG TPA: DUF4082 domain-containing protein, partial [Clostridia bacterium]|nr:DUF4082 domain-containing protein [Clostridia bacterium]
MRRQEHFVIRWKNNVVNRGIPLFTALLLFLVSIPIQLASAASSTIWSDTAVPATPDVGASEPIELGVKFRSDVAGTITGIRFYKHSANTGTHVGSLWTSKGKLLATAPFINESAWGWQQVNFANPVPIEANTVYVASYHCDKGHYSADLNYFSGKGIDNPPLHALASGVSGLNGVFRFKKKSTFPDQSENDANYWVDVVFKAGGVPTLSSIVVTPVGANIKIEAGQKFTATGIYSNGQTQDLSKQVTWISSSTAVATINKNGVATGVAAGTTTISASLSGVSGSTALTVRAPSIITTTTLPNGIVNASYSTTLSVSGGTTPYSWFIVGGALPPGLSLNVNSGVISGTPTTAGTFNLTVQARDSSIPTQNANKDFKLTIVAPPLTSIAITPANPGVQLGATQQFSATGTYADGSTKDLTSQVGWNSSSTAVATINASGLATGVAAGTTTISANLSGVSGSTVLTVRPPPLNITTTTLPNGSLNTGYLITLRASG